MKKLIVTVTIIIQILFVNSCYASLVVSSFKPSGSVPQNIVNYGNSIVGVFQVLGTIIAIGILTYIGIKLVTSAPSDKADIKSKMVPYIVGAIMIFSMPYLAQIIYLIVTNAFA